MMRKLVLVIGMFVLASGGVRAAELPTGKELLAKVTAAYRALTSLEVDMSMTGEDNPLGTEAGTAHFVFEKSENDGKVVERGCVAGRLTRKSADGKEVVQEIRGVNDGKYSWLEERVPDSKEVRVTKRDARAPDAFRARATDVLAEVAQDWRRYGLQVVGEDMIDGQKMFVLEGGDQPPGEKNPGAGTRVKVWVAQDDLIVRRKVRTTKRADQDEQSVITMEWRNVKINQPVAPALFVYTPPEGAKIDDRTKSRDETGK